MKQQQVFAKVDEIEEMVLGWATEDPPLGLIEREGEITLAQWELCWEVLESISAGTCDVSPEEMAGAALKAFEFDALAVPKLPEPDGDPGEPLPFAGSLGSGV